MSVLKAFEEMTGESLTGAAAPNGDQAAIKDAPVSKQGGLLGSLDDIVAEVSASAAPPVAQPAPVSARPAAIPSETETQPAISSGDAAKREADYLGTSLKRGWNTIVSAVAGSNLSKLEQLERDLYRLRSEEDFARDPELRASRDKLRDRMLETAQTIRDVSKENDALLNSQSTRPETKLLYGVGKDERGWVEAAKDVGSAIISNPMSLVDLGLGSGPASLASAASAIAVTLSTKNPVAGATAGGLTSGYVEFGNEYAQQREAGLSHEEAWSKAARKASVVGLLDGVSMSTAGKALDTILDATKGTVAKTALTKTVKETGRQAALGAAGEAGGSLLAGEPISPTNVILEAVGETVTAPIEAVSTARGILGETAAAESRREDVARRAAVRALDPNRDVAIDPIATVRPSDSVRDTVSVEQQATAVTKGLNTPEPPPEDPQAQNLSQQKPSLLNAADEVLNEFESQFVSELDAQDTAVEQPVAPPTFSAAVESMKADLGIDAAETLNLGLVETDTRLNRFKNALESAFGVNVHFVDFGDQLSTGSGQQLGAFNGYRSGDTILVNAKDVDLIDTTWHELTHVLETRYGDVYQSLRDTLVPAMDPAVRQQLVDSLNARRRAEVGRDLTEQELDSELVAYTVGDLVRSPETLGQMFDNFTDPQAAKTFRDVLMDVLQKMLAVIKGPQYIKERARLVEAQKAVTAAFAEFQKRETQKQMSGVAVTDQSAADANTNFARRVKPAPAQTVKAYKLFRVDPKKPGQLFPLFVNANDPVPMGEWLDAESGPAAAGGKVKSKLGPLAYRPGWHAGDLPVATHIGSKSNPALKKPDLRPDNHVWAEVELAADRDWQSVANQRGTNPDGKLVPVRAHITDQLPEDGYYRYKTNPNMTGNWLIGGSMKVNRILPDTEVEQINRAAGTADLRRAKPFNPARYALDRNQSENVPAPTATVAAPVVQKAPVQRSRPAKIETIEADESASYKRAAGQFSRDTQITGKFAGDSFMRALDESPQEMVEEYLNTFGREINTDYARELSPIYQSNPAIYASHVHEAASKLSKMAFDSLLQSAGPNDVVRFTAGGGGSGKGYALSKLNLQGDNVIIFDGTLSKLATATMLIDRSLSAGVATEIYYVNADAMWAFSNALKRASTKGRTVPIEALAEAHAGAGDVARQLLEKYAGSAPLRVVNNTPNGVSYGTIADIPRYNVSELKGRMYEELDRRVKDGYPVGLAIGFAPDRYSASAVAKRASERNDGPVREPARDGTGAPPLAATQQLNQPAEQVEQSEAVAPSLAPETIPGANKTQQIERQKPNPLLPIVDQKEAEDRISRRLKRKAGVGEPVNERRVIRAPGLPEFIVGKVTPQDWLNRVTALMSTAEMQDSRVWYRQLDEAFRPLFGDSTPKFALAWLLSQKRASPTKGFMDVLRAADMAAGNPVIKKAGLNQKALVDVLSDRVPEGGIGAKLLDFLDSELGRNTRTVVRDDPRGRQPAAIDVWAQRDIGFVDETVFEYLRKNYGEEAVAGLQIDKTTSGEAQYEYGIDFYNDVVDMLNEQGYDGGAWTAREVQAVGWVTMQRQMGIQAEFVRDIIGGNTRRVSIGLAPGANSVLSNKLAGKEIPVEVAQREISYLAELAGVRVKQNIAGVGAYLQWIEGAIQIDGVGSPEAVADFMDMVGYAFQQTEVINTRPLKSARKMAVDVMSPSLDTVDQATSFFSKFLEAGPKDKKGNPVAPGFQQITIDGVPGIRLLNFDGKWRQTQLAEMLTALYGAADALGIELADIATTNVELNSTKNDWSESPDGKNYINSLKKRGRVRQAELIQRRYPPSRVDVAGDGTISWERSEDPADGDRGEPESVGQFSRRLVELAANQDPRAPKLFGISETPTVLRAVGGPRQLLVMEPRNVAKVVSPQLIGRVTEEGGVRRNAAGFVVPAAPRIALTVDELRAIPQMLADPVAIIRQEKTPSRREAYKFLIDMPKGGYPVVAVLHDNVRYGSDRATELVSIYPVNEPNSLDTVNRELNSAQLLYFNKGKAIALSAKIAGKLPSLPKVVPTLAKNPGSVPDRALPPIRNSNFSRRVAIPGQNFTLPARTLREKYLENLFENRMSRVEDVQQAVEQQGGTLDIRDAQGNVVGSTDISSASQRMRGAVRGRLDRFKKEVEIPLIEDAAKAGVNLEEVAQYLYAVYAPERNAIIQQRNPTQFATDGGSGMTNAEAAQIVGTFRARRDFAQIERIAKRFQNITRMTQNILLDEGLVEPQIIAQWKLDNPNYVPLRGFENVDEETGNPLGVGSPGRLDPRNPFVKVAKGRETKAGQIIENILKDYTDAVVLAEKNKVNKLFLKFVRDNPDPALWQINAPKISRSYYKGGMTPMGYAQGTVRIAYEVNENPGETIAVRVQGRPVFIRVKDAAMLDDMQMAGAIGSGDQAKLYFRVMSGMMQTLAKLRTTLSPAFVFIDAIRNTETGGFWNLVKYGPKTAAKAYARLFKAARVAWKAERDGAWQGNTDTITIREPGQAPRTITLKEAYDMYRADGGKVGYLDIKEIEDIQKDIQQRFRAAQAAGSLDPRTYGTQMLGVVNKIEDLMLDAAGSVETAMRFATYMARLEAGANRQQATDAAKNVTVNFDRKGKWTPHLGLLYMFANANIQGTRATYNLIFKSGKAGALLGGSLIGLGYAVAQLAAGAIGDDDEPYWDKKLYKQSKIKNLVFFTAEGDTVTIPMAYGSGFFVNLGYALSDLQRGVPLAKVGAFMRDSFFTHFSPFGSLENPLTFATPTMLDPLAVIVGNQTEQGIPLMPDSSFEPNKPDSEKFWTATRGTMFQQLSRAMNDATGGTQGKSGFIDVSPETLRYGVGFLTGGAGGFVRDAADSILLTTEIGLDSVLEKNKIPILRSFYQQNTGKQNQSEFYENADEAVRALDEWKVLYGTEKIYEEPTRDRLRESRRLIALGAAVGEYKKALAALRYQEVAIVDRRTSGDFTAAEAEERLARIAERKNKLYVQFNRAFYKADPNTPD